MALNLNKDKLIQVFSKKANISSEKAESLFASLKYNQKITSHNKLRSVTQEALKKADETGIKIERYGKDQDQYRQWLQKHFIKADETAASADPSEQTIQSTGFFGSLQGAFGLKTGRTASSQNKKPSFRQNLPLRKPSDQKPSNLGIKAGSAKISGHKQAIKSSEKSPEQLPATTSVQDIDIG